MEDPDEPDPTHPQLVLDDRVHEDYAKQLIPRAVGYSAGLIDYFFRGKMDVVPEPTVPFGFRIKNMSPEVMGPGELRLFYDASDGTRYPVLIALGGAYNEAVALGSVIAPGAVGEAIVTFQPPSWEQPTPQEPGAFLLVFRGVLGSEEDAVIGQIARTAPQVTQVPTEWVEVAGYDLDPVEYFCDDCYLQGDLPFPVTLENTVYARYTMSSNGGIELLPSTGEFDLYEDYGDGTAMSVDHPDSTLILASFDDFYAYDGYFGLKHLSAGQPEEALVFYWAIETYDDIATEVLNHFEVLLYRDGRVQWNFNDMNYSSFSYQLYSGYYNGRTGTNLAVGSALHNSSYRLTPGLGAQSSVCGAPVVTERLPIDGQLQQPIAISATISSPCADLDSFSISLDGAPLETAVNLLTQTPRQVTLTASPGPLSVGLHTVQVQAWDITGQPMRGTKANGGLADYQEWTFTVPPTPLPGLEEPPRDILTGTNIVWRVEGTNLYSEDFYQNEVFQDRPGVPYFYQKPMRGARVVVNFYGYVALRWFEFVVADPVDERQYTIWEPERWYLPMSKDPSEILNVEQDFLIAPNGERYRFNQSPVVFHNGQGPGVVPLSAYVVVYEFADLERRQLLNYLLINGGDTRFRFYHQASLLQVDSFSPQSGSVGSSVTITGTHLNTVDFVWFSGLKSATIQSKSDTRITVIVPNGAFTGPITVSSQTLGNRVRTPYTFTIR